MDYYKGSIPIIDYDTPQGRDYSHPRHATFGCVSRDYSIQPQTMFAQPDEMQIIPESEWDARYDEQEETKSSLEHLYLSGPNGDPIFENLDQNGQGFCWAYSTAQSIMLMRAAQGEPMVRLSAHAVACKIKNFRDEGAWGGLSAKFATETGYPTTDVWPEQSMDRKYDTAETWANAAKHKIVDQWVDLTKDVYDRNLTKAQVATTGFNNQAGPRDYNDWSHSVCGLRWVRIEKGAWGQLILNSWKGWGRHGLAVRAGRKAIPDGALALQTVTASPS